MKLLDLFCGGGLAGYGYWMSGRFSEIVGVDINDMAATYPFDFMQRDALSLDYEFLLQFDMIHASPPCQAYSNLTPNDGKERPALIAATKLMLHSINIPHVIENVQGAVKELRPHVSMNGIYFGLPLNRVRHFYVSGTDQHVRFIKSGPGVNVHGSKYIDRASLMAIFGLNNPNMNTRWLSNLTHRQIEEGIPPIFTEHIARMLIAAARLI